MTITIIIKDDNGKQIKSEDFNTQPNENWEKTCYQIGCKVAKEIAESMLQDIEEKIFQKRDKRWKVKGFRQRTCVTRFGDVTVSRRAKKRIAFFLMSILTGIHIKGLHQV